MYNSVGEMMTWVSVGKKKKKKNSEEEEEEEEEENALKLIIVMINNGNLSYYNIFRLVLLSLWS